MRLLERVVWAALAGGAVWLLGSGMAKSFYIEGTTEALAEAEVGLHQIYAGCFALVLVAAYGWWRGAPLWALALIMVMPVPCLVLTLTARETLFPQLAFLCTAPFVAAGALAGLVLRWSDRAPAVPHATGIGSKARQ
jgi:hypothetical protein